MVESLGMETGKSSGGTVKVTTGLSSVVAHPEWLALGVMTPPFCNATPTMETAKLLGLVTLKTTSPDAPGSSGEEGVPVVATVTDFMDPVVADPLPVPEDAK